MAKKYASLNTLSILVDNIKNLFATKSEMEEKSKVQMITVGETENLTEDISTLKIHKLTKEQYEEALSNGNIDETALYLTPDEEVDLSGYATTEQLDEKADTSHTHNIADINELQSTLDTLEESIVAKSVAEHTHEISDITNLQTSLDEKVPTSRTINGKALSTDITLSATDVGADVSGSAETALSESKAYTDSVKNDLLNGAGAAYDTLKELGDLIDDNTDAIEALEIIASGKADASHTHNNIYYTKTEIDEEVSTLNNAVAQKSQVQIITWEADD